MIVSYNFDILIYTNLLDFDGVSCKLDLKLKSHVKFLLAYT